MRTGNTFCIRVRDLFRVCALLALCIAAGHAQEKGITLHLERVGLRPAIDSLIAGYGLSLVYTDGDVQGETVSIHCDDCTVETILDRMLLGTPLSWRRTGRQYILTKRPISPEAPAAGTLWGTVTDSATGEPIAHAAVLLYPDGARAGQGARPADGTETAGGASPAPLRSASANAYGFFSLRHVPAGNYRIAVKSVGYAPLLRNCAVPPGSDMELPFTLSPENILLPEVIVRAERSGFAIAEGVSGGTYIPATPSDQNQYFLEGQRIYDPSHQGGVVSTFNDDVLGEVGAVLRGLLEELEEQLLDLRRKALPDVLRQRGRLGGALQVEQLAR